MIYVYNGPGVSKNSFDALRKMLSSHYQGLDVCEITPDNVNGGEWVESATLFAMPGGRDLPYVEALQEGGMEAIRHFVKSGGRYLGICAGAYFAAERIEFEKGTSLEVIGKRYLEFYPGSACGTLFGIPYSYTSFDHATDATILHSGDLYSLFYSGGCYFIPSKKDARIQVHGHYVHADSKSAIVEVEVGKGRVLLSGVHFEYDSDLIAHLPVSAHVKRKLASSEEGRKKVVSYLLNRLMNNQ